jgi:hypothetical protein
MAISGGIKFFEKSKCDIDVEACTVTVSSGSSGKDRIRDRKNTTRWVSVSSNDATTETITIDLGSSQSINRIVLVKNNFKAFNVQYWNGSAYVDFSSVVTKEGTQSTITETTNAKTTNYYEFAIVSAQLVKVTITTTQTVDAQKYAYQVIITEEIGTLTGYPNHAREFSPITSKKTTLSGKSKYSIFGEQYSCNLGFNFYPTAADHAIILSLWEGLTEFIIYPCGGNEDQFRFKTKGDRLEDIYLVFFDGGWTPNYADNVYVLPLNYNVRLVEVA